MNLALDPRTEQRIQRELDRGHFHNPSEVIARALDLLEAEQTWLDSNREAITVHLTDSHAQIDRGEGIAPDHARFLLADRRAARGQ